LGRIEDTVLVGCLDTFLTSRLTFGEPLQAFEKLDNLRYSEGG
jgi:hypothetical protein